MSLVDKLSLVVLVLTLGAQILYRRSFWLRRADGFSGSGYFKKYFSDSRSFSRFLRIIWIISVAAIFGALFYWAVLQYRIWAENEITKFLTEDFGYFYSYVGKRIFNPWLVSLLFAILLSRTAKRLNKRFGERFFWDEEIELIAFGVFLAGYPGFFIYLILVLSLSVLASAVFTILKKDRLPLYYFWIPLAIVAIIIKLWLFPILGLTRYLGSFAF